MRGPGAGPDPGVIVTGVDPASRPCRFHRYAAAWLLARSAPGPTGRPRRRAIVDHVYPRGYRLGVETVREVDLASFAAAHAGGAAVIDVRESFEYTHGHIPGARSAPLGQLPGIVAELRRNGPGPVYVICASGNRSLTAAELLARTGIDAWSVAGGTGAWARSGRPIVQGRQPNAA